MFQRHDLLSWPAAQPAAEGAGKKAALAALAALGALGALRVPDVRRLLDFALPRPPPLAPWTAGLVALPTRSVLAGAAQPLFPAWLEQGDLFTQRTVRRAGPSRPSRRARVLTVANIKGGVAKTTSALNVALALSDLYHQRVLLVDLDGQASLTRSLPAPPPPDSPAESTGTAASATAGGVRTRTTATTATTTSPSPLERDAATLADYLRGSAPLASIIRPTRFPGVWLAPAAASSDA